MAIKAETERVFFFCYVTVCCKNHRSLMLTKSVLGPGKEIKPEERRIENGRDMVLRASCEDWTELHPNFRPQTFHQPKP